MFSFNGTSFHQGCQPIVSFVGVLVCVLQEFVKENHKTSAVLYGTVHIYADNVHMYASRIANYSWLFVDNDFT